MNLRIASTQGVGHACSKGEFVAFSYPQGLADLGNNACWSFVGTKAFIWPILHVGRHASWAAALLPAGRRGPGKLDPVVGKP